MEWTAEQHAILDHPPGAHAVVRAVPGAGKTTTLVGRVVRLCESGVAPARIRVVMFNKSVQVHFTERLAARGVTDVQVTTFDALGLAVLRAAARAGRLRRPLVVEPEGTATWARQVFARYRDDLESPEEIADAVRFWKAHLVPPARAAFPSNPALVRAYHDYEAARVDGDVLRVAYEDMVYTAVAVSRQYPGLLSPTDHFLVDEFQDVNPGRVELLRRLSHPGTAVMAVGDEDQGINEWTGAHPRFFRDFAATFPGLPTRDYTLSRSFRFGPVIATAANALIRHNADRPDARCVGGGETEGYIALVPDVGRAVTELVAEGWEPGDIAVLYRGRGQAAAVLAALVAAGVPLNTDDAWLLREGRGPELALAMLKFATSDAPVTMAEAWPVVFAPDRYIRKDAFADQVRLRGEGGLKAVLADRELAVTAGQGPGAVRSLVELARLLDRMGSAKTAAAALDRFVADVDVDEQLRARLRSEKEQDLAIAAFHAVHALLRGLGVAPADAAAALEALDVRGGRPPEQCVWVSTIHKAKGLEWRTVLLPELSEGACPAVQRGSVPGTVDEPAGVPQSPWIEQERRIFYVGLTRAVDQVLLHAPDATRSRFVTEAEGLAEPKKAAAGGAPWTAADDMLLRAGWARGDALTKLQERLGRSASAVAARLVRLRLVDSRAEARKRG